MCHLGQRVGRGTPASRLTDDMDGGTLVVWKERGDTILMLDKPCHSASPSLARQEPATSVVLLRPMDLLWRAASPSAGAVCPLSHDTEDPIHFE